jgi:hypothetical protein
MCATNLPFSHARAIGANIVSSSAYMLAPTCESRSKARAEKNYLFDFNNNLFYKTTKLYKMEVQNSNITGYNDFEKFIGHSEFARVLELAQLLKEQKSRLDGDLPRFAPSTLNPQPVEEEEDAYPFDESASYIRSALIGKETSPIIKRGTCAITDSLIDETITTLASELRFVLNLKEQLTAARAVSFSEDREVDGGVDGVNNDGISNMESEKQASADEPMKRDITIEVQNKENANKFSKHQTDILINWMIENREEPYLSVADISYLTQATGDYV